jgi:hypothetical protein
MTPEAAGLLLVVAAVGLGLLVLGVYLQVRGYGGSPGGDSRGPEGGE